VVGRHGQRNVHFSVTYRSNEVPIHGTHESNLASRVFLDNVAFDVIMSWLVTR